ncbi:MAG: hypothetical protein ACTHN5_13845 [Phycisphaerae bacterium]
MKSYIQIRRHHARGTVMVLVVAVLGLLAVIGTVYVLSSRTERNTSNAMSEALNLDLARDSVNAQVQQVIGNAMLDGRATPDIGGYGTSGTLTAARNFDYPEINPTPTNYGQTAYNNKMKDEPWLVRSFHVQSTATFPFDMTELTANRYDPSAGTYSLAYPKTYGTAMFNVMFDQTNKVSPYTTVDNTSDKPDTISATPSDSYINLLPFSDASGIRYRFGVRIIDTNRMANLNTGDPNDADAVTDTFGQYFTSMRLAPDPATGSYPPNTMPNYNYYDLADGTPTSSGNISHFQYNTFGTGRLNSAATVNLQYGAPSLSQSWQTQMLRIEKPLDQTISLFDLTDELELRAYGEFGTPYHIRPAVQGTAAGQLLFNTLGVDQSNAAPSAQVKGNPRRRNYTTYSYSRDIRPYPDLQTSQQFTANGAPTLAYPMTYAKVPINLSLNSDPLVLDQVATEVANAMKLTADKDYAGNVLSDSTGTPIFPSNALVTPFTQDEIAAFTINYIGARWNGMIPDPATGAANAYFLPNGPSFVDVSGVHIRTATSATAFVNGDYTGANDVKASTNTLVAYAAQPFINEVALYGTASSPTNPPAITDCAIELYNPYQVPLSLNGFKLTIDNTTTISIPAGKYIPANGFFVITTASNGSNFTPAPVSGGIVQVWASPTLPATGGTTGVVKLYRPYTPVGGGTLSGFAQIDEMNFAALLAPGNNFNNSPAGKSWGRDNTNASATAWGCAYNATAAIRTTTLGALNGGPATGFAIYDRFAGTPQYTMQRAQQSGFANIAEFNRTMRICHQIDAAGDAVIPNGLVTDQMYNLLSTSASAPFTNMQFQQQAKIYFDFRPHPGIYSACPPDEVTGTAPVFEGDIRATRLLDQITCIDRVADTSIDIGGGATDIDKIRLPGQINVNTASGDVLRAIPNMTDQMVANILAYRDRTYSNGATVTYNGATSAAYAPGSYPGSGFRSLAELIIPISDAGTPATLPDRDALWAKVFNLCTVRSDTFAVYGYLEAVRQNPNAASFDNSSDWYSTGANVSDDPNAGSGVKLIRVARRRWVAIMDRSWSNTAQTALPSVVAIKDLPY